MAEFRPEKTGKELLRMATPLLARAGCAGAGIEAWDLVQSTFERAWKSRRLCRAQSEGAYLAWLRVILGNVLRDHLRRNRTDARDIRREVHYSPSAAGGTLDPQPVPAGPHTPVHELFRRQRRDLLNAALGALQAPEREAVALYHAEGKSLAAVARTMGCPKAHVAELLGRGCAALHTQLRSLDLRSSERSG